MTHPTPRTSPTVQPGRANANLEGIPAGKSLSHLGLAILGYLLGVTLIVTLLPFRFSVPGAWRVWLQSDVVDVVANVIMFVPLGFLFRVGTHHHRRHSTLRVLWAGAALSLAIESVQLFEAERFSSPWDVGANAVGAWVGAVLASMVTRRIGAGGAVVARLSLELPLMGLLYLVIPLLWLNGLAARGNEGHLVAGILVATFGAAVLGGLQRHHLGPDRGVSMRATLGAATFGFLAGAFPALATAPGVVLAGAGASCAITWLYASFGSAVRRDRRYEVAVIRTAVPPLVAFLVLLGIGTDPTRVQGWTWSLGFPPLQSKTGTREILQLLELVAAFTLLGYVIAEYRGRAVPRLQTALPRVLAWSGACGLTVELIRGFTSVPGASLARTALLQSSALYGAWLYYLQRRHVLLLLASEPTRSDASAPGGGGFRDPGSGSPAAGPRRRATPAAPPAISGSA